MKFQAGAALRTKYVSRESVPLNFAAGSIPGTETRGGGIQKEGRRDVPVVKNDFSKGSISKNIMTLAIPMTAAQLVNVLYSVVDRI